MSVKIVTWPRDGKATVERFLKRPAFDKQAEKAAASVLSRVEREGDRAVCRYAREFDGAALRPGDMRVKPSELKTARSLVDAGTRRALKISHDRIVEFARAGLRADWTMPTADGGTLGEKFIPLERVGVYVPSAEAPLVSTALMTATLARVAGVKEIVACSASQGGRSMNPVLLHALELAGATELYRVGGVHAVGMMAYGTRTVRPVRKIVGPGGAYVTAAKRQVYGQVALDLVAGPSEIAVLADDSADARYVAADLLSQAEHGTGAEKGLLVTSSAGLAREVQQELETQSARLSRSRAARKVMSRGMLLVVVPTLDQGMDLCNRFAPEHFEIMVRQARRWVRKVTCAGAIFVGKWSPECTGDFVAGPSHVLPTGGAAAMFSGLTVDDFRRRSSVIAYTRKDLQKALPVIEVFGRVEGLDGHARSASVRFEKK